MTDLTPALIAAFVSLLTAGLAATVSMVVSMLAKEQKTSEFRQQWINDLRNDLALFASEVVTLRHFSREYRTAAQKDDLHRIDILKERYNNVLTCEHLLHRILLRLNPNEHTLLTSLLGDMASLTDESDIEAKVDALVAEAQRVLKTEWNRVKKGESGYRATMWIARALVVFAVSMIAYLAIRAI